MEQASNMPAIELVPYFRPEVPLTEERKDAIGSPIDTFHLGAESIADETLRAEMLEFAAAFYEFELPETQAVMLTDMLILPWRNETHTLLAWLTGALADLTGQRLAAHMTSVAKTGSTNELEYTPGPFFLHSDMWHTELLFNLFNKTMAPGQGDSYLISIEDAWPVIRAAGVPETAIASMKEELAAARTCAAFTDFNGWLYLEEHPWADELAQALMDACEPLSLLPGQGYFVNDRYWLHGRNSMEWTPDAEREHRLYRVGYNNRRLMEQAAAEGFDWASAGTRGAGCHA
jgi:hypothetical protein